MLFVGAFAVIAGLVMFWQREKWARQAKVIMEAFGLKTLAAKPVAFWVWGCIIGIVVMWAFGLILITIGIVWIVQGQG